MMKFYDFCFNLYYTFIKINYYFYDYLISFTKRDYEIEFFVELLSMCKLNKKFNYIFIDNILLCLKHWAKDGLKSRFRIRASYFLVQQNKI